MSVNSVRGNTVLSSNPKANVLIVDDNVEILALMGSLLEANGYTYAAARSVPSMYELLKDQAFDAMLLDIQLGEENGLDHIGEILAVAPSMRIAVLTAHGSVDSAVRALSEGASSLIEKSDPAPIIFRKFEELIDRDEEFDQIHANLVHETGLVGSSLAMKKLVETVYRIRDVDSTVLVTGESGVGKEVVAKAIHRTSKLRAGPFLAVNCAAISDQLLESELFGHRRGSFTDAKTDRKGYFEECEGGTLVLDEIGEMSPRLQTKLLRVLQEREVLPIGSNQPVKVNTRIIAATNRDLEAEVARGNFRQDLFYRLSILKVDIAPLRERKEDIPALVQYFLRQFNKKFSKSIRMPSQRMLSRMSVYDWPGNVRELHNAVERAVILTQTNHMRIEDLLPYREIMENADLGSDGVGSFRMPLNFMKAKMDFEKHYLKQLLRKTKGNIAEASRLSGQYRANLYRLLNKHDLHKEQITVEG